MQIKTTMTKHQANYSLKKETEGKKKRFEDDNWKKKKKKRKPTMPGVRGIQEEQGEGKYLISFIYFYFLLFRAAGEKILKMVLDKEMIKSDS